jgi:hypothetical protein
MPNTGLVGVGVAVRVGVAVALRVTVAAGVAVGVAARVDVALGVAVGVIVLVAAGVAWIVGVGVVGGASTSPYADSEFALTLVPVDHVLGNASRFVCRLVCARSAFDVRSRIPTALVFAGARTAIQ